jgi:hypothetical protein
MIILELAFLAIEVIRLILWLAEKVMQVLVIAWNVVLAALSLIGVTEQYALQKANECKARIAALTAEINSNERHATELCLIHAYWSSWTFCWWFFGQHCIPVYYLSFTSRNRYNEYGCPLFRQVKAIALIIILGIALAAKWIEMKLYEAFNAAGEALAKAGACTS